jgi:hypothetical protein
MLDRPKVFWVRELDDQPVGVAPDRRVADIGQRGGFAGVVGLSGQGQVHFQNAPVELLDQPDRLVRGEVQGFELRRYFGEDRFKGGDGVSFLELALTHPPLPFVLGLVIAAVTIPPVAVATITVPAVSLAHGRSLFT